jgi:uncharacterized protein YlxW (UPF0749 family)
LKNWWVPVTLVAAAVGMLMAAQFKAQAFYRQDLPSRQLGDLVVMLKDAKSEHQRLSAQADALARQLASQKTPKGVTVGPQWPLLTGPGVEVVISDSAKPLSKGENPNIAIVHNEDLLRIVNELRASGAEALAINDQRLVESTEISCAGPTILVNKSRLTPPFDIRAIGNPDTMLAALQLRGGVVEYLQFYGIQVNISKKPNVLVPMFQGGAVYQYAKPLDSKKAS